VKRRIAQLLLLSLALLLNGCWSKNELNELAIVVAIGVEKVDDEFEISVQVVEPSEVSATQPSTNRTPVTTYHAKGSSIFEAVRSLTILTPRKLYLAHVQMMIIGEELSQQGVSDALDFFARDHAIRNDFYIVVSSETTPKQVLETLTSLEKVPANKMHNSIEVSEREWASTSAVQLDELIKNLSNKGNNTVLSTITIQGKTELGTNQSNVENVDTPAKLQYSGLAVFKQDKLIGLLTEEESKGYNYLKDKVKSTIETISCPDGRKLSTEVIDAKTKVKGKIKNGIPSIDVSVRVNQNVAEVDCNIDLTKIETINLLDKETSKLIKENIMNTLDTLQKEFKADVLGYSEALHRADYKEWNKIKNEWVHLFPELEINVSVDVHTQNSGNTQNSMLHNTKE